jgi:5-hydroxyisourate hydrolase-like protein (transthyretin family)
MYGFLLSALLMALVQTPAAQTGGVEGRVVRIGTSAPIEEVEIRVVPVSEQASRDASEPVTDRDGRFSIADLKPGSYLMMANKSGYAAQIYGARQTGIMGLAGIGTREEDLAAAGTLIRVIPGQVTKDLLIRMTPAATVSGRVLGSNGEPLVGMQVELLPVTYDASGRRSLNALTQVDTDDRGEYRLFTVEPGRYYISARWTRVAMVRQDVNGELRQVDAVDSNGQRYSPAYYPSSPDLAGATIVEVKSGEDRVSMDILMRPPSRQPRRLIKGNVVDSTTGQAPPPNSGQSFGLIPRNAEALSSLATWDPHMMADGSFELRDVAEGAYWLVVRLTAVRTSSGVSGRTAVVPVDLFGGDVERLTVNLMPLASITGRVVLDDAALDASNADGLQIRLNATRIGAFTMNMSANPQPALLRQDGTFAISNISPGEYDLTVTLPPDTYVKDARYGSADALEQRIPINGPSSNPLQITISSKVAQLSGVVVDRDRKPVSDIEVVLVPEGSRRPDLYKTARTDASGRYLVRAIAPGSYRVYSWETIERFRYFDAEYMRQFERSGKSVKLAESEMGTIDLDLIPAAK